MMGPKPHTQLDADLAAGMGMPDNGPKLMPVWGFCFGLIQYLCYDMRVNVRSSDNGRY